MFLANCKILLLTLGILCGLFGNAENFTLKNESTFKHQPCLKKIPLIVFLITEDSNNYQAHLTIPAFADMLTKKYGYNTRILLAKGPHGASSFPDMNSLSGADLLVVFARRIALPHMQMNAIKTYLASGKPLIGIRTANHAFSVNGKIGNEYEDWPGFAGDILGCENRGYGPVPLGTDVSTATNQENHSILKKITPALWHSHGNLYLVKPLLDNKATILLHGSAGDLTEPIAWTRIVGNSKIFYTSLGYPDDFNSDQFITLMLNSIKWALANTDND